MQHISNVAVRMVQQWSRLLRETVKSSSLGLFKTQLNKTLSKLDAVAGTALSRGSTTCMIFSFLVRKKHFLICSS